MPAKVISSVERQQHAWAARRPITTKKGMPLALVDIQQTQTSVDSQQHAEDPEDLRHPQQAAEHGAVGTMVKPGQ